MTSTREGDLPDGKRRRPATDGPGTYRALLLALAAACALGPTGSRVRAQAAEGVGGPTGGVSGGGGGGGVAAGSTAAEGAGSPRLVRVTWQQALERAAARNPSALVAEQEILRAEALVREARAGWLPTLSGNGSYTRLDSPRRFNGMVATPADVWNGNIQLTVPVLSPTAWANDWHAEENRRVAVASATDVRYRLATAVGRAYLTVLLQHRRLELTARARDNARDHYDFAHARMNLGLGNGVDEARAEQELRTDEAQLQDAETALLRAQSALAVLLSDEDLVDATDGVALEAHASEPEAAIQDARQHRPDVKALEARRQATSRLRRDEWVYYAPSLLAQAQAFRQTRTTLQPASGWQAVVVLSIPLFDGGLRTGIRREREVSDNEARAQLEGMLRQVSVEVRAAFRVLANSDQSLRSAQLAARAAATAARLADKAYRAGATTNLEVVDAERRARDAESQVALAEDGARQARLDLLLATGAFP